MIDLRKRDARNIEDLLRNEMIKEKARRHIGKYQKEYENGFLTSTKSLKKEGEHTDERIDTDENKDIF